jgi:hypothetical protein
MKHIAIILALTTAALAQQPAPEPVRRLQVPVTPKLYIEPRIAESTEYVRTLFGASAYTTSRNISQEVTANIMKRCPGTVIITTNPEAAQFTLAITSGASAILNTDGDVVTTLKAHWVGTVAKDVCTYFGGRK